MDSDVNVKAESSAAAAYHEILDTLPVALALMGKEDNFTLLNAAFVRTFGYTVSEVPNLSGLLQKLYQFDADRDSCKIQLLAELDRVKQGGAVSAPVQLNIHCKDGSIRSMLASAAASPEAAEQLVVLFHLTGDPPDLERLVESEQPQDVAAAGAKLGRWESNFLSGKVLLDERLSEMLGYEAGELDPDLSALLTLLHPDDGLTAARDLTEQLGDENRTISLEFRLRHKDGHYLWVESRCRVTSRDAQGQPSRMSGTLMDITARKESDQALRDSEAFNLAILESLSAQIAVLNRAGDIVSVNSAWRRVQCELLESSAQAEPVGLNYLQLCRNTAGVVAGIESVLEGKHAEFTIEYPCHIRRSERWFCMRVTPLRDSRGGAVVSHQDVTERVMSERARNESDRHLRASQWELQLMQTVVSHLNDLVVVTDAGTSDGSPPRIIFVNDAFVSASGYTREETIGKSLYDVMQGVAVDLVEAESIRSQLINGKSVRAEMLNYTKGGEPRWMENEIIPVFSSAGELTNYVVIKHDITERRLEQDALRERTAQYQKANEALQRKALALREILESVEGQKRSVGDHVVANIEKVIMPLVRTLGEGMTSSQKRVIQQIEASLEQVLSPFTQELSKQVAALTPTELKLCNLIRNGLGVKQIAAIEHLSPETVSVHRRNIRRKLGIAHKKLNLATYLTTFLKNKADSNPIESSKL